MLRRTSSASSGDSLPLSGGRYEPNRNGFSSRRSNYGGYNNMKGHHKKNNSGYLPWIIAVGSIVTCISCSIYYKSKHRGVYKHLDRVKKDLRKVHNNYADIEKDLRFAEQNLISEDEREHKEMRNDAIDTKIERLQKRIQRESHREISDGWGNGPFHIKFDVLFTSETDAIDDGPTESFTVELAPLEVMPHAVHFFIEQVYHELWNGATFVLNAGHILQAGPHSLTAETDLMPRFTNAELDTLAFQEYNPEYPHKKYTLGFAGRPGGPDFYINKIDNTIAHGPEGQKHHALSEEADPCFGKVNSGFEVVDKMFAQKGLGSHGLLEKRILIKKAVVIEDHQ